MGRDIERRSPRVETAWTSATVEHSRGRSPRTPIVLDIGGTNGSGVREIGSFGEVFVAALNLTPRMPATLEIDGLTLEGLPRPCCDGIFSSYMVEHVPYDQADRMFAAWFEVLRVGGRLEIRCPDAEWTSKQFFLEGRIPGTMYTEILLGKRVPGAPFYEWCHQNLWWYEKLAAALANAGFVEITRAQGNTKYLHWWPYDLSEKSRSGFPIIDLRLIARKPMAARP